MAEKKRAGFKIDSEAFQSILFLLQSTCRARIERKHTQHDPQTPPELQDRVFLLGIHQKSTKYPKCPLARGPGCGESPRPPPHLKHV